MSEKTSFPFKSLGIKLKTIRQKLNESVDEVSGAVEIDRELLEIIEKGIQRPDEDILLLLISHFGMKDDEAAVLWKLANYEKPPKSDFEPYQDIPDKSMVLVMALDPRVIYSDSLNITVNNSGVVMNFSQSGDGKRPIIASRIGMSKEQAHNVLRALQDVLHRSEMKQLPPSSNKKDEPPKV